MAEKKPSSREQVKQIVAGIEGSIQELFQSERYADYLHTMSRFHTYSVNNTILIHFSYPWICKGLSGVISYTQKSKSERSILP